MQGGDISRELGDEKEGSIEAWSGANGGRLAKSIHADLFLTRNHPIYPLTKPWIGPRNKFDNRNVSKGGR